MTRPIGIAATMAALSLALSLPARAQQSTLQCGPANLGQLACMQGSVCRCSQTTGGTMLREPPGFRWSCDLLQGACSGSYPLSGIPTGPVPGMITYAAPAPAPGGPATHEQIATAQQALKRLGFDPGPIDGVAGPRTRQAVAAYQKQSGRPGNGELTADMLRELQ